MTILKKSLITLLAILILYMQAIVIPKQKAEAFAFALPAGVTAGAGVYVLGALALGAVVMAVNETYGEEIQAHAKKVWKSSTQLAMDSLYAGYELAHQAGQYMVNVGNNFATWAKEQSTYLIAGAVGLTNSFNKANGVKGNATTYHNDGIQTHQISINTAFTGLRIDKTMMAPSNTSYYRNFQISNELTWNTPNNDYGFLIANSLGGLRVMSAIYFSYSSSTRYIQINSGGGMAVPNFTNSTNPETVTLDLGRIHTLYELDSLIYGLNTVEDFIGFINSYELYRYGNSDVTIALNPVHVPTLANDYIVAKNAYEQSVDTVKTNGIPIPVPDVYPVAQTNGLPLTWDPDTSTYKDLDGIPYTGEVGWNIPIPRVIEGTGQVVIPIENDLVDIITGDIVTTVPTNPTNPINPPNTDWLSRMKGVVTTKFPFSLPWDFYGMLSILSADPIKPHIEFSQSYMGMPVEFEVKFDFIDPYIVFFRTFIIIGFCISLIMGTRKLLGGAT